MDDYLYTLYTEIIKQTFDKDKPKRKLTFTDFLRGSPSIEFRKDLPGISTIYINDIHLLCDYSKLKCDRFVLNSPLRIKFGESWDWSYGERPFRSSVLNHLRKKIETIFLERRKITFNSQSMSQDLNQIVAHIIFPTYLSSELILNLEKCWDNLISHYKIKSATIQLFTNPENRPVVHIYRLPLNNNKR